MNKAVISLVTILVLQFISITAAVPCDPKCAGGWGYGVCQSNGRCRCWWGWNGPNAVYITSGVYKNRILADYCTTACHYTHVYRSPLCARIPTPPTTTQPTTTGSPSTGSPSTGSRTTGIIPTTGIPTTAVPCDPKCKGGQGVCQSDGRCFCWWGWTGPNAVYITTGVYKNRIKADYCTTACHYTHDYLNPACASFPTPSVCSVPVYPIVPPIPCDPLCGTGSYYGRGTCKSNGRCLCWWGWTGPNACYVDGGTYNNRILADRCVDACHYTHDYRNYNCIKGSSTTKLSTQPPTTGNPGTGSRTTAAPAVPCDPRCKGFHTGGNCSTADGRCYCFWGWTGPHAEYITVTGPEKNRIKADYCTTACHYTHDYLNPACASIPTPQVCSVPVHPIVPPIPCDPLCGTGKYYGKGNCTSNGRCLCWWGWTGPNACYVDGGTYNNRILADRCVDACHYTHDHRNYNCTNGSSTAKPPTTGNPGTGSRTTGIIPTTRIPTTGM
ncbi:hypothetical protein OS493_008524 [Desmophyllum pertusum]|uniref:Uncharacterized protein n=1 Tax=Desmophyllum pertusum TaxID=174260 RepID=A0A9X0D4B8_9CNID|nr:hypothetical protein OS493_008524 [Desmophyllum pertusum]